MKSKGKKKVVINKEETAENWCFVCKDGGDLRICDYKECLKSYHPDCVGKRESFLESEKKWACDWHTCFRCRRSSHLHCYTCTKAACRRCLSAADVLQVKGKYGFCNPCLKLALLIEENKDCDSDGEKVDFTDRETCEGLFMEYYYIIKKEEGFEAGDLYAAQDRAKMEKNHQSGSAEEWDEEEDEEEQISDYDDSEDEKCRKTRKRSEEKKPSKQTPLKFNKKEFIGWASSSLIEFLTSIGKSTSEKLSQHDVTSIVNEKRTISKYRVYDLLEDHFAENNDESEEDEVGCDSEDNNAGIPDACKRQRKLDMEEKSLKKDLDNIVRQSCFAAIVVENVKLVYLKRSVLEELLKQPKSFEEKVTGCFVRVKCDPYDYRSRISHQLMQVKGVRTVPAGEENIETALLVSAIPKEIQMRLVSDGDFLEEECEDLRQRVLAGELERPTVVDLQQKAKVLHEDITKNHMMAFLVCDFNYNVSTLFEYLEKRKILQSPSGQARLLENVPTVIPDISEPDSNSGGIRNDIKSGEGSPQSILPCDSSVPSDGLRENKASAIAFFFLYYILLWSRSAKPKTSAPPEAGGARLFTGHLHLMPGDSSAELPHINLASLADKYGPIFTIRLASSPSPRW
ncbi:hypothetical protein DH2020_026730 [Rehmannia glutinosa]|uniref:Plus3 domain-containing protein n=1 Tax=Rehmannia glutinosa TaxID=99300 RepID=A0ABR0VZ42_REHGL